MDILQSLFSGPLLPATLCLCLLVLWSLLALLGAIDIDLPGTDADLDLDVDVDVDAPGAADGLALFALKWLNISDVPLVLWMGTLSIVWWLLSAMLWSLIDTRFFEEPGLFWSSLLVARNLLIAVFLTKLLTQPMTGWFRTERLSSQSLIGKECYISSSEATPEFGQVKYQTDGAPLLLNVRTDGAHLAKGAHVWITHYDTKRRVYIVSPTTATPARLESTQD